MVIIGTIFVNMLLLAMNKNFAIVDLIFTGIYTLEVIIKVLSRGFVLHTFSYLRNPWNWLDFTVVLLAYLTLAFPTIPGLSALRAFRALKMIAILPGLKTIIGAIFKSARLLMEVLLLMMFVLLIIALFGLQIFKGVLTHKCIKNMEPRVNITHAEWENYIQNKFVMFGAHYIVNLVLAVVAASYEKEAKRKQELKEEEERILELRRQKALLVLSIIFIIEAILKVTALNPMPYVRNGWNAFDFIIVLLTCLEWILSTVNIPTLKLSMIRSLRMLRVFKLAKNWKTLNTLINIIFKSLKEMGNLTLIVIIVIYIFTVIGMQLVGHDYENKLETVEEEQQEAEREIYRPSGDTGCSEITEQSNDKPVNEDNKIDGEKPLCSVEEEGMEDEEQKTEVKTMQPCLPAMCTEKCICCNALKTTFLGKLFLSLRTLMFKVVNNRVFDGSVLFVILLSTMTLTLDDKYLQKDAKVQLALRYLDYFYAFFFNFEMIVKVLGLGLTDYFTNVWTLLDFFLVVACDNEIASVHHFTT
ncbi:hypothetical protein chiPu_0010834 [Chiloscyllium punctatum]|uniref:Ion transport domain-containing protein n=1 Tax=Chiloscyllium punctatum TaxID=137246 RepID=A0A401SPS9_CHIPU|nr:hypothetical protein [Chiloscyllium punctatum]